MAILSGGILAAHQASQSVADPGALGDRAPVRSPYQWFSNNDGLLLGDRFVSYSHIYKTQPQVAALVIKLAFLTGRTPVRLYRKTVDSRDDVTDSDPMGALLRRPNLRHSPFFFWSWVSSTFDIYGEALVVKQRPSPGAPPTALWPMHPANTLTQRGDDGSLWYVVYSGQPANPDTAVAAFPEQNVIHFKMYNPDTTVRGLSRLEPLRGTLAQTASMQDQQSAFWRNGARPSVLLSAPARLSQRALERLKAQWDATHAGVESWGKTAVLEEGITANVLPMNAVDLQIVESRKLSWDEACSLFDVPPPAVHILDNATYSNISEQMRSVYRDTMQPRFKLMQDDLDTQLLPDFHPQGDHYTAFYMDEQIRGDIDARFKTYQVGIQNGIMMPAEARALENLPDAGEESHLLYGNAALVPLGLSVMEQVQHIEAAAAPGDDIGDVGDAVDAVIDHPTQPAGDSQQPPDPGTTRAVRRRAWPVDRLCGNCEAPVQYASKRGWCRSCEGRDRGKRQKELTA